VVEEAAAAAVVVVVVAVMMVVAAAAAVVAVAVMVAEAAAAVVVVAAAAATATATVSMQPLLKGLHFAGVTEIQEVVTDELKKVQKEEFSAAFQKLYDRTKACIYASCAYFE
jgi:hypothetical protein